MTKKSPRFKRPVPKAMFSFRAPFWSMLDCYRYQRGDLYYIQRTAVDTFFEEFTEEKLFDWAGSCDYKTVRELLQDNPTKKPWIFNAYERGEPPKSVAPDVAGFLHAGLERAYDNWDFDGRDEPKAKLSRVDQRELNRQLEAVASWWLGHVRIGIGGDFYHPLKTFKLDHLDVIDVLEQLKPEWLDVPVLEDDGASEALAALPSLLQTSESSTAPGTRT